MDRLGSIRTVAGLAAAFALGAHASASQSGIPARAGEIAGEIGARAGEVGARVGEVAGDIGAGAREVGGKAGEIATQPVRDVGLSRVPIPPVLLVAMDDPYSTSGGASCADIAVSIATLDEVLGPDYGAAPPREENRAGRLAEAGARTAVNSLLPFRSLVREATGAAPAQRRHNDAVDAGLARRGFLRGLQRARNCRVTR